MPLPVIAGVVRGAWRGTVPTGQQWVNVFHARYAGGASTPGHTEIDALDAQLVKLYGGAAIGAGDFVLHNCAATITTIDATYYNLDGVSVAYVKNHPATGSVVGGSGSLPSEVAHCLTIRTNTRGRRYRGRVYFPPFDRTKTGSNGNVTQAVADAIVAQITGVQAALVPLQWSIGVASYGVGTTGGVPTTWTPFFTDASSFTMDLAPDVQRRRRA